MKPENCEIFTPVQSLVHSGIRTFRERKEFGIKIGDFGGIHGRRVGSSSEEEGKREKQARGRGIEDSQVESTRPAGQ